MRQWKSQVSRSSSPISSPAPHITPMPCANTHGMRTPWASEGCSGLSRCAQLSAQQVASTWPCAWPSGAWGWLGLHTLCLRPKSPSPAGSSAAPAGCPAPQELGGQKVLPHSVDGEAEAPPGATWFRSRQQTVPPTLLGLHFLQCHGRGLQPVPQPALVGQARCFWESCRGSWEDF